jgi:NAD(P)-dependent dehydrogenase (short-subunit alcohol dehydrogenase family)
MSVNFFSAFEIAKLLIKRSVNGSFLKSILFISSVSSVRGVRGNAAYCASKGALDAMMRSLALELGPRIRVNSVLPGAIQTAMTERHLDDASVREKLNERQILGVGTANDIADCVEFVVSSKAGLITGHQFIVDGGFTIG